MLVLSYLFNLNTLNGKSKTSSYRLLFIPTNPIENHLYERKKNSDDIIASPLKVWEKTLEKGRYRAEHHPMGPQVRVLHSGGGTVNICPDSHLESTAPISNVTLKCCGPPDNFAKESDQTHPQIQNHPMNNKAAPEWSAFSQPILYADNFYHLWELLSTLPVLINE